MKTINYLLGYKDRSIVQDNEMFHFSLDSVLLPNFVTIRSTCANILDIGTGNAPIPLILSTKTSAHIIGVELQKNVYDLAKESVRINHLEDQITIIHDDINELSKTMESDSVDLITCNPPFFKIFEHSHFNDSEYQKYARHEVGLNLNQLFEISKKLLKNNGIIGIVHRPERMLEIFELMKKNRIEPKRIQFVYPKEHMDANIILIEGTKNGKPGLKIMPPLYVHSNNGEYTDQVKQYFERG